MKNIEVLKKHFKKGMKNNDFEAFQKSHPTLVAVILGAMNEKNITHQLFVGKVSEEIGMTKTVELIKEVKEVISIIDAPNSDSVTINIFGKFNDL